MDWQEQFSKFEEKRKADTEAQVQQHKAAAERKRQAISELQKMIDHKAKPALEKLSEFLKDEQDYVCAVKSSEIGEPYVELQIKQPMPLSYRVSFEDNRFAIRGGLAIGEIRSPRLPDDEDAVENIQKIIAGFIMQDIAAFD